MNVQTSGGQSYSHVRNAEARVSYIKTLSLSVFLLMGASVFQFYPMLNIAREVWYVGSFFYCVIFAFFAQGMLRNCRLSGYEIYLFLVIALMPLVSAISAKTVFGQPLMPGVLTHRNMSTYGSGIALLYWLKTAKVSLDDVRRAILTAGWMSFFLYIAMTFFMDATRYAETRGFVGGGVVEPYHFIFKSPFIVFLVIYYAVKGIIKKSLLSLVLMLPLIFYLVFMDGGRSQFASLMIVLLLIFIKFLTIRRFIIITVPFSIALSIAIMLAYHIQPDEVEYQVEKFQAAIDVVLTGERSSDASANARLKELDIAMPYIKENLIFGNGQLSAQWQGGYFGNLGAFAPSDIGIWGLIFVYGIFGLLVFYGQFLFAWLVVRKQNKYISRRLMNETIFRVAIISFVIFLFIDSLATGRVVFAGAVTFLFISILYMFVPKQQSRYLSAGNSVHTNG